MQVDELRARIEAELQYARAARQSGKEGRARVCARRAAGWAVSAQRANEGERPQSALQSLRALESDETAPLELRKAAGRLVVQVDEQHELPHSKDPLEDANLIVTSMLGVA